MQVPLYWSDVPRSKFIKVIYKKIVFFPSYLKIFSFSSLKEGSTDIVTFTAKLTISDRTAKWYFNDKVRKRSLVKKN
jgi:hypothetical protein